jgi:hypothetical protein
MVFLIVKISLLLILTSNLCISEMPKGSLHGHLSNSEVTTWLHEKIAKKYPTITTLSTIGRSIQNRPLEVLCLGEPCVAHTIQGEALYTALHHAREPLGLMALVAFIDNLLTRWDKYDVTIKHLLKTRKLVFFLVVNPDGYVANEIGNGMRRKNMANPQNIVCPTNHPDSEVGVDLNRNYAICFDGDTIGSSRDACAIDYEGPSAFSEPETQAVKLLVNSNHFGVAFNYHSFGKEVYIPYSCKTKGLSPDEVFFEKYAGRLTKSNGFHYGQPWREGLYSVNGDAADWMYATQGIFAVSPEVAPADPVASEHDGFWITAENVPKAALETLEMNYVGAWTCGVYLELSDLTVSSSSKELRFSIWNWGLKPSKGSFIGALIINSKDIIPVEKFEGAPLSLKGQNSIQGSLSLAGKSMTEGVLVVRDDESCVVYKVGADGQSFSLLSRIGAEDESCLYLFYVEGVEITISPTDSSGSTPPPTDVIENAKSGGSRVFVVFIIILAVILVGFLAYRLYRKVKRQNQFQRMQDDNIEAIELS